MMSVEYIKELSKETGREAAERNQEPFIPATRWEISPPFPFPNLGDYLPDGWEPIDDDGYEKTFFVDSSGMGAEDEPALTHRQFIEEARSFYDQCEDEGFIPGFAITETGQFQLYVSAFKRSEVE
jgi:hypothetical protein|tara:strand:- start:9991 stop:10365 length:375 start_codon:yes stop_codon:yes gene_type:complete